MGYRIKRRTALVTFEGGIYEGAQVRCRFDVDFDTLFVFQAVAEKSVQELATDVETVKAVIERFGDEIVMEWNLEDDLGQPIPVSGTELKKQPVPFGTALVRNWVQAMTTPSLPLGSASSDGATSEVPSTATEM